MRVRNLTRVQQMFLLLLVAGLLIETGVLIWSGRADRAFDNEILLDTQDSLSLSSGGKDAKAAENSETVETEPDKIKVYIAGSITKAGVYELNSDTRVEDVVKAAGGVTADADLSSVNLAQKLKDEDMIYIPKIGEAEQPSPSVVPSNLQQNDNKIDINKASVQELDTLPGIGPAKAQKIVDYREQNGSFKSIEDIQEVSGIGPATFENIKDLITVR